MNTLWKKLTFATGTIMLSTSLLASPIWIDVRSEAEHKADPITGDLNIAHTGIAQQINQVTSDKNADIRVYCRSGHRSEEAKMSLEKLGYSKVSNAGGIADVRKAREF